MINYIFVVHSPSQFSIQQLGVDNSTLGGAEDPFVIVRRRTPSRTLATPRKPMGTLTGTVISFKKSMALSSSQGKATRLLGRRRTRSIISSACTLCMRLSRRSSPFKEMSDREINPHMSSGLFLEIIRRFTEILEPPKQLRFLGQYFQPGCQRLRHRH